MVTHSTCKLLGNWYGYVIQCTLGLTALCTLLVKWWRERPRRAFRVWFRDASKQALSALVSHGWNVLFAEWLRTSTEDPCTFYMVNYMVDNVAGIFLNWLLVRASERVGERYNWPWLRSGDYGRENDEHHKNSNIIWLFQLWVWICIITANKFALLFAVIRPLKTQLYNLGDDALGPLEKHPKAELAVVMIIIPLVVNILAFWIQDNFLMDHKTRTAVSTGATVTAAATTTSTLLATDVDDDGGDDINDRPLIETTGMASASASASYQRLG